MARKAQPWFRVYVELFRDPKIRRLKPEYRWLYMACLGACRQSPEAGVMLVAEGLPMEDRDIADYAGMDVRSVRAGMKVLEQMGLIVSGNAVGTEWERGGIAYRSPTFQNRQFESDDVTKRTRKHRLTRANTSEGTFHQRSTERSKNGGGNTPETETETETEENTCASADAERDNDPDTGFDEFWDTYDKKVGKKTAEQKWRLALKKPGVDAETLIAAASRYVTSQRAEGKHPTYTKDPTRWLNGEHWNDAPDTNGTNPHELPPPPKGIFE